MGRRENEKHLSCQRTRERTSRAGEGRLPGARAEIGTGREIGLPEEMATPAATMAFRSRKTTKPA